MHKKPNKPEKIRWYENERVTNIIRSTAYITAFALASAFINLIFPPNPKSNEFEKGVKEEGRWALDGIANPDTAAKIKQGAFNPPIPAALRNQAATPRFPADKTRVVARQPIKIQ